MTRYVAIKPRAWVANQEVILQERPSTQVWEADDSPIPTGLLSADGTPLYRVNERHPIGYRVMVTK